jgi:tetratricopeptide (TPR) repeat protein
MDTREDYILRFIGLLSQAIAQILNYRVAGRYDEALLAAFSAQEKLFGRKTAELAALDLEELLRLLRLDETNAIGREKVLGYAALLRETGLVYEAMSRHDLAVGCFQLALHGMLTVVVEDENSPDEVRTLMRDLLARIPPEQLHAPVMELLRRAGEAN